MKKLLHLCFKMSYLTEMIVRALAAAMPPATDQSDAGKYAASDLMIATGSPDTGNEGTGRKTLNLSFAHQFTLLILEPQIHVTCIEPADAGFTYRNQSTTWAPDTKARQVTMNGIKACKMDNGTFRAIIAPQEKGQVASSARLPPAISFFKERMASKYIPETAC